MYRKNSMITAQYIKKSEKGMANGVCPLDINGQIPASYIDPNVLKFMGTWDGLINSPALSAGMATSYTGNMYICSVAGTQFGLDFIVGDFVVYDGANWKRVSGAKAGIGTITNTDGKITIDTSVPNTAGLNLAQVFRWGNGALRGLLYNYNTGTLNSAGQMKLYGGSTWNTYTNIQLGFSGLNGGNDSDMVGSTGDLLALIKDNLPFVIRILDTTNTANYATYSLTSDGGYTAYARLYGCSYIAAQSTLTTTSGTNANNYYILFDFTNKTYITSQVTALQTSINTNTTNITTNTNNITTLQNTAITSLTTTNPYITISGTGNTRALTGICNTYLNGNVQVSTTDITIGATSYVTLGYPFSYNATTTTIMVNDDLIIRGDFYLLANAKLMISGNLIVYGVVQLNSGSSLTVNGNIIFQPNLAGDTCDFLGCNIVTYGELSVRNYTVQITASGVNQIYAKTITFDSNYPIYWMPTSTNTWTCDTVVFNGNYTGSASEAVRLQQLTLYCVSLRITNNYSSNTTNSAIIMNTCNITANILEITGNYINNAGSALDTISITGVTTFTSDKILVQNNYNVGTGHVFYVSTNCNLNSKNLSLLTNYCYTSNTSVYGASGSGIRADFIHITTSALQYQNLNWVGTIYGLYSNTRNPQYIIDNAGSFTIAGFNADSYLGVKPFCYKYFADGSAPFTITINGTSAGTAILNPTGPFWVFSPTLGAGYTQFQTISQQFSDGTNAQLVYTGKDNAFLNIVATVAFATNLAADWIYVFEIWKKPSVGSAAYINNSSQLVTNSSSRATKTANINCFTPAQTGDAFYLSMYILYAGATSATVSIYQLSFTMSKMSIL